MEWSGLDDYRNRVGRACDALLTKRYAAVRACFDRGLVSREEALAYRPAVTLDVGDLREEKTELPSLLPSGVRVRLPPPEEEGR